MIEDRARAVARTTHPMHAEVVRSVLPGARRRLLCRQLADAMEATGLRRHDDVLRFLNWRLAAGESAPIDLLVRGAWQATDAADMRLAERFARARSRPIHPRAGHPCARRCDLSPVPPRRRPRGLGRKHRRRRPRPHRGDHSAGESAVGPRSPRRGRNHPGRSRRRRSPIIAVSDGSKVSARPYVPRCSAPRPRVSRSRHRLPTTRRMAHAPRPRASAHSRWHSPFPANPPAPLPRGEGAPSRSCCERPSREPVELGRAGTVDRGVALGDLAEAHALADVYRVGGRPRRRPNASGAGRWGWAGQH